MTGTLHLDYFQQPPSHTLEISGTAGVLPGTMPMAQPLVRREHRNLAGSGCTCRI
jgi:hypothetical protein